jgi:hypothetical protein
MPFVVRKVGCRERPGKALVPAPRI